jgi:hypothetical protein
MNYPKLEEQYILWLDKHNLQDIDKEDLVELIQDNWHFVESLKDWIMIESHIISDLLQIDRRRKLEKLQDERLRRMNLTRDDLRIEHWDGVKRNSKLDWD